MKQAKTILSTFVILFGAQLSAQARTVHYDLVLAESSGPEGSKQKAMTINGSLPGPTLRFTEGDDAVLMVKNDLPEATSIHWHGLLVPNDQDGVPHVTMAPIESGEQREFRFRLRQSGTFWFHSHSVLQEQLGVYGSIVITPKAGERIKADHDVVALLSDWTDEKPKDVLTQLRAGREWQAIKKGTAQSWLGAFKSGGAADFFKRSLTRMPPMDISDVAYDQFLINGKPEDFLNVKADKTVRIRLINSSASTYYFIEFAGTGAKIISADGIDVQPVESGRFLMAIAETYDLLVKVPKGGAYELRATAQDGSGKSSFFIGTGERRFAPDVPKANLYSMGNMSGMSGMGGMGGSKMEMNGSMKATATDGNDQSVLKIVAPAGMEGMDHGSMQMDAQMEMADGDEMPGMDHSQMKMPQAEASNPQTKPSPKESMDSGAMDHSKMNMPMGERKNSETAPKSDMNASEMENMEGMDHGAMAPKTGNDHSNMSMGHQGGHGMTSPERPGSPYEKLRAIRPTTISDSRPLREYLFRLQGDMIRYVWTLDGKTITEADTINIRHGEKVRFTFVNETMMPHPMHLHGHFFRVVTSAGAYSPLKHTVDVPPFETRVIEFAADEPGDWMMHCHVLYHQEVGMARVVHYEGLPPNPHLHGLDAGLRSNHDPIFTFGEGTALSSMSDGFVTMQNNRNGLLAEWEIGWENVESTQYEANLSYNRYLSSYSSVFAGAELTNGDAENRGVFGFRYLLPLMIQSTAWIDTEGDLRVALGQSIPLTPRLAVFGRAEYDTNTEWEGVAGLEYVLGKRVSLVGQWHSEYGIGGGFAFRF